MSSSSWISETIGNSDDIFAAFSNILRDSQKYEEEELFTQVYPLSPPLPVSLPSVDSPIRLSSTEFLDSPLFNSSYNILPSLSNGECTVPLLSSVPSQISSQLQGDKHENNGFGCLSFATLPANIDNSPSIFKTASTETLQLRTFLEATVTDAAVAEVSGNVQLSWAVTTTHDYTPLPMFAPLPRSCSCG